PPRAGPGPGDLPVGVERQLDLSAAQAADDAGRPPAGLLAGARLRRAAGLDPRRRLRADPRAGHVDRLRPPRRRPRAPVLARVLHLPGDRPRGRRQALLTATRAAS